MAIDLRNYEDSSENKDPDRPPENRKSIKSARKAGLILSALILLLGGFYFWPSPSPKSISQPLPPGEGDDNITFTRGNQDHYFRENQEAGHILVITGLVRNSHPHERSFIRLRTRLLASDGSTVAERFTYAGNVLSEDDLKHLRPFEIIARLSIKGGQDGRNMNIKPGEEIPFMVVFDKLPATMADYRIDPDSSAPADLSVEVKNPRPQAIKENLRPKATKEITDGGIDFARGGPAHYYRENEHDGKILIMTGMLRNNYSHKRSFIRLRAYLLSLGMSPLAERYCYAGNVLSDEELRTLPMAEITSRLNAKSGQDGRNMNIEPGAEIPFMVVFDNLPDDLNEPRVYPFSSSPADIPSEAEELNQEQTGTSS